MIGLHPGGKEMTVRLLDLSGICPPAGILELGAGGGDTAGYLKSLGFEVKAVDLNPAGPDVEPGDMRKLDFAEESLCGQRWAAKANVVFYWSFVPYRSEWRYGIHAHRMIMVDMGHVGENLYLACTALGLGTCGIGAYDQKLCDKTFQLDGEEEFTLYTQSVGTVKDEDEGKEKAFYSFVEEQGL